MRLPQQVVFLLQRLRGGLRAVCNMQGGSMHDHRRINDGLPQVERMRRTARLRFPLSLLCDKEKVCLLGWWRFGCLPYSVADCDPHSSR